MIETAQKKSWPSTCERTMLKERQKAGISLELNLLRSNEVTHAPEVSGAKLRAEVERSRLAFRLRSDWRTRQRSNVPVKAVRVADSLDLPVDLLIGQAQLRRQHLTHEPQPWASGPSRAPRHAGGSG